MEQKYIQKYVVDKDTDYYQLEDNYYNFIYLSDCCNAEVLRKK